jgi:hypothetical protein
MNIAVISYNQTALSLAQNFIDSFFSEQYDIVFVLVLKCAAVLLICHTFLVLLRCWREILEITKVGLPLAKSLAKYFVIFILLFAILSFGYYFQLIISHPFVHRLSGVLLELYSYITPYLKYIPARPDNIN